MPVSRLNGLWLVNPARILCALTVPHRHASLTSAIGRGVRKGASALKRAEQQRVRQGELGFWEQKDPEKIRLAQEATRKRIERNEILKHLSSPNSHSKLQQQAFSNQHNESFTRRKGILYEAPVAVPYSTAGSEFLYGTFAVLAALKSNRRKIYKLYAWDGNESMPIDNDHKEIIRNARKHDIPVVRVAGSWDRMLEKMSGGRPHNGYVLEASAIPKVLTTSLSTMNNHAGPLELRLGPMSDEERSSLKLRLSSNGLCVLPRNPARKNRYPLVLWLDRVTDTGNMGAIFRSALYFGVDAILVPQHGTAPFSAVTVKASAGAVEQIPILTVKNEVDFLQQSQHNGWKFLAAGMLSADSSNSRQRDVPVTSVSLVETISKSPCVLMLGNEGEGLRPLLLNRADMHISIKGALSASHEIDSLNVSVAAAILTAQLLHGHEVGNVVAFENSRDKERIHNDQVSGNEDVLVT